MTCAVRLPDDCFALPRGIDWTPVDEARGLLRAGMRCVAGTDPVAPLGQGGLEDKPSQPAAQGGGQQNRPPGKVAGDAEQQLRA